jgi:nucleoid DNA-binding protein
VSGFGRTEDRSVEIPMNKHDLIASVAQTTGATKTSAAAAIDSLLDSMTRALTKGEAITFVGFGTFKTTQRRVVRFTPGKVLKNAVR